MTLLAEAVITVILFAAGYLSRWAQDGFRQARISEHVAAALRPGRCDWCDGFTTDRRTCNCTQACTFVPLCGWEANRG